MNNNLINFLDPKTHIKSGFRPSILKLAFVYGTAFVIVLAFLNGPLIVSLVKYPLTHSEQSDNEKLTAQYIELYGRQTQEQSNQTVQSLPVVQAVGIPVVHNNSITISKINVTAPIIQVPSDNEQVILNALKTGVVLYPGSSYPGQNGSTIIVGHSSSNLPWTNYSAIFSLVNKLDPNDFINISFEGKKYTYQVKVIRKGSVQQILDSGLGGDLILSSCWPVGTDNGRIVVVANLVR